ncbi:MAG: IS200/IS605 family transposase [Bacteroidota bacterium]
MANTYTQLYVQIVFAVKRREALIPKQHKEELHKYITGIVKKRGQKLLAVHAMPDHIHIFIGFKPTLKLSDLVRDIKTASSQFIREKRFTPFQFNWQEGYGAFTYAHSQVGAVCRYIENQEQHHKKKTFRMEYLEFLEKFEVTYEERYAFDFLEE